jgi:uncharacterized membrane protein YfcA
MSIVELGVTLAVALVIGALIGSIGIGGVLLTPWLTQVIGLPVRDAIVISSFAFIFTGLVALAILLRSAPGGAVRWPLVSAVVPGAWIGAWALSVIPGEIALWLLAVLTIGIGAKSVMGRAAASAGAAAPAGFRPGLLTGAITGFASALTGTGGPMVMVPLLLWLGAPMRPAILMAQAVQLPVALSASAGNLYFAGVDILSGSAIGLMLVPGALLGHRLGSLLPLPILARLVGVALIAAGVGFAFKAAA